MYDFDHSSKTVKLYIHATYLMHFFKEITLIIFCKTLKMNPAVCVQTPISHNDEPAQYVRITVESDAKTGAHF